MPKYKGVIIGAGAAAAGYDFLGSQEITTPAHGLKVHPRTSLEGFFDLDSARAKEAATKWQTKAFANLATMLETVKPDIVCVCTPDETHAGVLQEIIKYHRPKLVIAEKPLTTKLSDSNKVLGLYDRLGIPVLVNYRRRFDEIVQKIQQELARGEWGQVVGATAVYGKGLLHGGSHMIDLARFLLGEVESAKVDDEQFDMYGEEALGDAVKQRDDIELSDQWYESLARKFIQDYGTNLEGQWEELLVKRYCSSVKATSGVEVDTEKLLKCVKDLLEEREELHLKRNELKESASRRASHMLPEYVESKDPVKELLHTNCSASQYVALAKSVFKISETIASHSVRNGRLNEGLDISNVVPFSSHAFKV
jgi:hypothetical protein